MAKTECTVFPRIEVFKGFAISGEGGPGAWALLLHAHNVWVASFAIEEQINLAQLQCVADKVIDESLPFAFKVPGQGAQWHKVAQQFAANVLAASIASRHNENTEETIV